MNTVITAKEAKQITGGRTPLVPFEYESAIKALTACVTIDDAKYWSDKADALAAWAKIYHSDEAGLLRAYMNRTPARQVASTIGPEQIGTAKKLATDLIDWLDEFEQHLPKGK